MYEAGLLLALSLFTFAFAIFGRKITQLFFGKEIELDALAEDGSEMAAKFSLRAELKRKESFFYKVLAFSFLLLGSYGIIRLGPLVSAKDNNFWSNFNRLNNPALVSLNRKEGGFNKIVEDAAKKRYSLGKKASKANQIERKLISQLSSAEKKLKNFNANEIRANIKKASEAKILKANEKRDGIQKRLKKLEEQALKETDPKIFQEKQIRITNSRKELRAAENSVFSLKNEMSDQKSINSKIQLERHQVERNLKELELAYQAASQDAELANKLLNDANNSYEVVVKDYLELLEKAGGSSSSDWFFITNNIFRALGLLIVSFLSLKLFNLHKHAQKLATFYRSRADLVNAFLINNYDMDITMIDTIMMFTPDSLYAEEEFSKKIAKEKQNSQKERIRAVNN